MERIWGTCSSKPTDNIMDYSFEYNPVDRSVQARIPSQEQSIYVEGYIFTGDISTLIKDYNKVPSSMKKSQRDQWKENV